MDSTEIQFQIDEAQQLLVSIPETETRYDVKGKSFTVYKIQVRKGFSSWFVYRRYSEFVALHAKLSKIANKQTKKELQLPKKKVLGSMKSKVIGERKEGLLNYLLVAASDSEVVKAKELWDFLGYEDKSETGEKRVNIEDFDLLNVLGRGSFGKVMLARKKDNAKLYAIKVLNKADVVESEILIHTQAEKHILQTLQSPFLVGLEYSFQTEDKLYMVLDYISGGDLFFHLQNEKFDDDRSKFYAAEIILALKYLHEHGIVYRDLKPENILLRSNGHLCLTDFGLCKEGMEDGQRTNTFCGSLEYMAPEVLEYNDYSYSVDWWGLGIVLYMMLTGRHPFYHSNQEEMCKRILTSELRFPSSVYVSKEAKDILLGLLHKDPSKRLGCTLENAQDLMEHEFFEGIDWDQLSDLKIDPPFIPNISDEEDVTNFDPEFTSEEPVLTPSEKSVLDDKIQDAFSGFTYVTESVLDDGKDE
eukprot:TRINITY_DN1509_c0_g1_i3.p1 TRINITY_DN1509_c0_g1~~TRINITY_DN1509_c0_g1_i3.p1  ORF type:complete len:552 (+),score=169.57 TRINITY_DN1509_c0_g1_i3:239-1657(+)